MTRPVLTPRRVRAAAAALAVLSFAACQQRMAHPPYYRPLQETDFWPDHRSSRPLEEGVVHRAQILDDDPMASGLTAQGKQPQTVSILNAEGAPVEQRTGPGIPNKLDNFVSAFPFRITAEDLKRGQQRYQIYCVPCHGPAGNGRGKIVERGFLEPPSFHTRPVDPEEGALRERQRGDHQKAVPPGEAAPPGIASPLALGYSRGFNFYRVNVALRDVPVGYIFEVISKGYGGMPDYSHQVSVPDRWRIAAYVRTLQLSQNPPGGQQ